MASVAVKSILPPPLYSDSSFVIEYFAPPPASLFIIHCLWCRKFSLAVTDASIALKRKDPDKEQVGLFCDSIYSGIQDWICQQNFAYYLSNCQTCVSSVQPNAFLLIYYILYIIIISSLLICSFSFQLCTVLCWPKLLLKLFRFTTLNNTYIVLF